MSLLCVAPQALIDGTYGEPPPGYNHLVPGHKSLDGALEVPPPIWPKSSTAPCPR